MKNKDINALANLFYRMQGCHVPMDYDFAKATHPAEKSCWALAKASGEFWKVRLKVKSSQPTSGF